MYNTERYVFYPNLEVVTVIHFRKSHCHQKRSEGGRVGEEETGRTSYPRYLADHTAADPHS